MHWTYMIVCVSCVGRTTCMLNSGTKAVLVLSVLLPGRMLRFGAVQEVLPPWNNAA